MRLEGCVAVLGHNASERVRHAGVRVLEPCFDLGVGGVDVSGNACRPARHTEPVIARYAVVPVGLVAPVGDLLRGEEVGDGERALAQERGDLLVRQRVRHRAARASSFTKNEEVAKDDSVPRGLHIAARSDGPRSDLHSLSRSVCYERSETAAGFSAEDLKRAEAQWREQGSPKGLTSD